MPGLADLFDMEISTEEDAEGVMVEGGNSGLSAESVGEHRGNGGGTFGPCPSPPSSVA